MCGEHFCDQSLHMEYSMSSSAEFVAEALGAEITNNPSIPIAKIQDKIRADFGEEISNSAAYRAKEKVLKAVYLEDQVSYAKIDYFQEFIVREGGYCDYTITTERNFEAIFVCPKPCSDAFHYLRPLIVLDGCFLKTKYKGQLLLAVAVDSLDELVLLSYAIVSGETSDNWKWFLKCLGSAFGIRGNDKITFISDRYIGLIDGMFPGAYHGYCVRHICGNIRGLFKDGEIEKLFTKAAYATSTDEFEKNMDELKSLKRRCIYLY